MKSSVRRLLRVRAGTRRPNSAKHGCWSASPVLRRSTADHDPADDDDDPHSGDDGHGPDLSMPRILFVSGFHPATRAKDLAYEFERLATQSFFLTVPATHLPSDMVLSSAATCPLLATHMLTLIRKSLLFHRYALLQSLPVPTITPNRPTPMPLVPVPPSSSIDSLSRGRG